MEGYFGKSCFDTACERVATTQNIFDESDSEQQIIMTMQSLQLPVSVLGHVLINEVS